MGSVLICGSDFYHDMVSHQFARIAFRGKWTYNKQAWKEGTYRLLCLDVVGGVSGHDLSCLRGLFNDLFTSHFVEAVLRLEARRRKSQCEVNLLTFDLLSESSSSRGAVGQSSAANGIDMRGKKMGVVGYFVSFKVRS